MKQKKLLVIDGQGGRMGAALVSQCKAAGLGVQIIAVGANSAATGENPVVVNARDADVICGPMGILTANALWGEITPAMAAAVSESRAQKVLIPVNRCSVTVVGVAELPLGEYVRLAVQAAKEQLEQE